MTRFKVTDGHQVIVDEHTYVAGDEVEVDTDRAALLVSHNVLAPMPAKKRSAKK